MKPVGSRLHKALKPLARKRGFFEADLFMQWEKIVPEFAPYAYPDKMFKGKLTLAVASDSAKMQVSMNEDMLKMRLNSFYGYEAVEDVRYVTKPFKPHMKPHFKKLQPSAEDFACAEARVKYIKDAELRESLKDLAAMVEAEKKKKGKT